MSIMTDLDKINIKFEYRPITDDVQIIKPIKYVDRYKVKSIEELYDMLTSDAIFAIMLSDFSTEIKSLDELDYNDWDIYDQVGFIMGMEKYYDVDISDEIANGFTLDNVIPKLKRDETLNRLGI
jgi:hypothetical protein